MPQVNPYDPATTTSELPATACVKVTWLQSAGQGFVRGVKLTGLATIAVISLVSIPPIIRFSQAFTGSGRRTWPAIPYHQILIWFGYSAIILLVLSVVGGIVAAAAFVVAWVVRR